DEFDTREGRVLQKIVVGKKHDVAQLPPDTVVIALPREKPAKPLLAEVRLNSGGGAPPPGGRQGPGDEGGADNPNCGAIVLTPRFLQKQNADRIGLLAGGAAGNPDSDRLSRLLVREQLRQYLPPQRVVRLLVPEECGDRYQQVAYERLRLVAIVPQELVV